MRKVIQFLVRGLVAALPLALTIYAVYWLLTAAEDLLGKKALEPLLPADAYVPGMGVAAGVVVLFVLGLLTNLWLFRRLIRFGESVVERIPLVRSLYGAIRDLMSFFEQRPGKDVNQVVAIDMGENRKILGLLTRQDCTDLPAAIAGEEVVAVYLPMSYQIGGYTLFLPRSQIEEIDLDIEEGMRLAITAGITTQRRDPQTGQPEPDPQQGSGASGSAPRSERARS
jgi:uncharacterized membrane protein